MGGWSGIRAFMDQRVRGLYYNGWAVHLSSLTGEPLTSHSNYVNPAMAYNILIKHYVTSITR
jgi:hypothetical protein